MKVQRTDGTRSRRRGAALLRVLAVAGLLAPLAGAQGAVAAPAAAVESSSPPLATLLAKLPAAFVANEGQDDEQVRFTVSGAMGTFLFTPEEVVHLFVRPDRTAAAPDAGETAGARRPPRAETLALRQRFVGANPAPEIVGTGRELGPVNFYRGGDPAKWRTGVPTFSEITYREIYPGIDLVFKGTGETLEYDFVIRPGADPTMIRLVYDGVESLRLDDGGDLVISTAWGELREKRPHLYQTFEGVRREVGGRFQLASAGEPRNSYGFAVDAFDAERPLVIDPVLSYSTFLGGGNTDYGRGIAVDASGFIYVTGNTYGSFPLSNAYQSTVENDEPGPYWWYDVFVTKLDPSAAPASALVYSTYLGGGEDDFGFAIAVDSSGNAYVTGQTKSVFSFSHRPAFPTTAGSYQPLMGGCVLYVCGADYLCGTADDLDPCGTDGICGTADDIPPDLCLGAGDSDAFVAKFDSAGLLVYSTYLGGSANEYGMGIAVDSSGNAYVTGITNAIGAPGVGTIAFPTTGGAYQTSFGGGTKDAFVTKVNPSGSALVYSTHLGAGGGDEGRGIAIDGSGNAYVTGYTDSAPGGSFPATSGAFQTAAGGGGDAFVTKVAANGASVSYSTYLGGTGLDQGYGIAVDGSGNAYVAGLTGSPGTGAVSFPTTASAYQPAKAGLTDCFVTRLNTTGSALSYSSYLGGEGDDRCNGIAHGGTGQAYVTGRTTSDSGDATPFPTANAFQETTFHNGRADGFVARVDTGASGAASLVFSSYLGGSGQDLGEGIAVDTGGRAFVVGPTNMEYTFVDVGGIINCQLIGTAFPTTAGSYDPSYNDDCYWAGFHDTTPMDVFIAMVSANNFPEAAGDAYATPKNVSLVVNAPGVLANDTDFEGSALTASLETNVPGVAGSVTLNANGSFTYTPAAGYDGVANFTYTASDGTDPSAPATVAITVTNTAPVANAQSVTTNEDTARAITLSGTDANGDALTYSVAGGPSHGTLSGSAPNLTYSPTGDYNGTDSFTFTVNDGTESSAAATVSITVTAVNDAPSFTKGADQTVLEDADFQEIPGWMSAISAGPADEAGQALVVTLMNDNPALFLAGPSLTIAGTLSYAPAPDANGTATVTVTLGDDGGTANGGSNSSSQTFTITVTPVNDGPSFTRGADQTVLEDAGAQTVPGWATAISAGPANESSQAVSFLVSNDNSSLFSAAPAVSPTGTLSYTPAANANGSATVSVRVRDSGGTANGGVDTSATQTFTITVTGVNDPPGFTRGANQTVLEDAGAQTVAGWATAISAGPGDEAGQTVSFLVSNDNTALFSAQPAVAANGTLTYTPAANANGSATVSVRARDNGGTAGGGVDTSAVQTFTVTVTAVNDEPSFTRGADQTALEDAGAQTVPGWATAISAGPADESSQTVSFLVSNDNSSLFSAAPAVSPTGTLSYTPAADANGSATVSVSIRDGGGTANGGDDTSAAQSFTITVTAVNDAPVASGQSVSTDEDTARAITLAATDVEGDTLSYTVLTNPLHGTLTGTPPSVTYLPSGDYNGSDSFIFRARDAALNSNTATVSITVTAVNDAPVAVSDAYNTCENVPLAEEAPGVLGNDTDVEGDSLTASVVSTTSHGTLSLGSDGSFTYTPTSGYTGTDSFTYRASDGNASSTAGTVTLTVDSGCAAAGYELKFSFADQATSPKTYANWLPTDGGLAEVTVQVVPVGGSTAQNVAITLTQQSVTTRPGRYTNDSDISTTADFDVTFSGITNGRKAALTSKDYGGSITLRATATAPDGSSLDASFTVPKDSDGDGLPDAWENPYGGLTANGDDDASVDPADTTNTKKGDLLTNLEEYRGFKWGPDLVRIDGTTTVNGGTPYSSNPYQTAAYVPSAAVAGHFRTNPTRKDVFGRFWDYDFVTFDTSTGTFALAHDESGIEAPFAIGAIYFDIGIDVHVFSNDAPPGGSQPGTANIKFIEIVNDLTHVYTGENGGTHIKKDPSLPRIWTWAVKGDSVIGSDSTMGTSTTYQIPLNTYFADRPYIDDAYTWNGSSWTAAANGLLDHPDRVEDQNDDGTFSNTEKSRLDGDRNNGPYGDVWAGANVFNRDLTTFDIDDDSRVELPRILDPSTLSNSAIDVTSETKEYTKAQVLKQTVTHEIGHAMGIIHQPDDTCLMYQTPKAWDRDGYLSNSARALIRILNK